MNNLRFWSLIQIQYSTIENAEYFNRAPNVCRLLPVYNLEDFEKSILELENKYSKEQVTKARTYASIVYCDYDLYEIENIIQLELNHGEQPVKNIFARIDSTKSKTNSQRSMRYVVGVLKNLKI